MDLQAALAELEGIEDDDLRDAMAFLVKKGLIIDSGKRRNGRIVWVANPDISAEEKRLLLDQLDQ
jgi:hypothetical protein